MLKSLAWDLNAHPIDLGEDSLMNRSCIGLKPSGWCPLEGTLRTPPELQLCP